MTQMQNKPRRGMDRRTFLKRGGIAVTGFLAMCALPFYSFYRERNRLETVRLELGFRSLPAAFDGIKIVHFSDVHYGFFYGFEQFAPLIDAISGHQPDLILYTGDLFDNAVRPYSDECSRELRRLQAPLGKFAVPGNHDYYTGRTLALQAYEQGGFRLLINDNATVTAGNQSIQLAGLDDMMNGRPNLNAAFAGLDSNRFTLLLAHEPDFAARTSAYRVDLQLSGHSHGGQVRLPFAGAVLTPPGGRKYVQGLYALDNRDTDSYVYTTRGIGTTHIPVRFLCRPELTVITLKREV